ncbi:MAG: protein translocase SEC61 complex subunit gamma [Pyrodictiaceae archaeon]
MAQQERGLAGRTVSTLREWRLILMRLRKPDRSEFIQVSKVILLGMLLIGGIAYAIHAVAYFLIH